MTGDELLFCRQLTSLVSVCREYDEMQAEILNLLESSGRDMKELADPVLALLDRIKSEKVQEDQQRQAQLVKSVINTLSYTELEVVLTIFEQLGGPEGKLIAGKAADGLGITRSVVVNALRKLEGARIIETRSLGVKGTYIKVLNPLWLGELRKLQAKPQIPHHQ